jgi:hypothetical protein
MMHDANGEKNAQNWLIVQKQIKTDKQLGH